MKNAIPDAVLRQHSAFLGKTGSGKTSTAKLAIEQILRDDPAARVCVLDPIKSDWWGLTSSSDGKRPGLPFHILGGPRGHVQLHESAGKAIGELVATGALPLSIIDMADFSHGGLQKFFNDFAPALMRKMRGVVYLVLEEAHEFAPKERSGIGAESLAIHFAKKLATAGRSKGIRLMLITQRTQALHNALLGSCDTMIAHRLTAPADQEPVKKWLKANVDKDVFEKVSSSLSSLKTGSGWICSGEAQVAELVQFPKISTYDNSATPTGEMTEHDVKTAPVDRDRLRAIIGDAVKVAEEDDPKALRAEISRLNKRMSDWAAHEDDSGANLAAAEQRGYSRGFTEAGRQADISFQALKELARTTVRTFAESFESNIRGGKIEFEKPSPGSPAPGRASAPARAPESTPVPRKPSPAASGDGSLSGPQQKILNSLATWARLGERQPSNAQVAWLAGYSPNSTSYTNPRSALNTAGLIQYPNKNVVEITAAGAAQATAMELGGRIIDFVLARLPGPEAKILRSIANHHPRAVGNEIAAGGANYSSTSTSYTNPRSALRTKDLIDYPAKDQVRAADWLFAA